MRKDNAKRSTGKHCLLAAAAALAAVTTVALWTEVQPAAGADKDGPRELVFNAASQRRAILKAQQETNRKLDKIFDLLAGGKLVVVVENKAAADRPPAVPAKPAEPAQPPPEEGS
jgi:hypothetical protein